MRFIRKIGLLSLVFFVLFTWGCGKKPKPLSPQAEAGASAETSQQADESTGMGETSGGSGTIMGKVVLSGAVPPSEPIRMDADPFCKTHADTATSETFVVGPEGGLKNVLVFIKSGQKGKHVPPPPQDAVLLDQVNCHYVPHVAAVRVGQVLEIRNSDGTLHNVHAIAPLNKDFNVGQPTQGMVSKKEFKVPEVAIRFKCDVHPWMGAYVAVLDHPWFAITDADGTFSIPDVPAGTYTLEAWHEAMPPQTLEVTVSGGETAADFTFQQ